MPQPQIKEENRFEKIMRKKNSSFFKNQDPDGKKKRTREIFQSDFSRKSLKHLAKASNNGNLVVDLIFQ